MTINTSYTEQTIAKMMHYTNKHRYEAMDAPLDMSDTYHACAQLATNSDNWYPTYETVMKTCSAWGFVLI